MSFRNLLGWILSKSMFTQKFIETFHSVQEIGQFPLFFLEFGKASTDDKCHFAIPWARSFQHQIVCKLLSKYSKRFRINFHFFFRIWTSAKPRPIPSVIWQSHGLYLVNTNVYTKFHHNIQLSSRERDIFTFSEFGARQNRDRWKMTFHSLLG